MNEAAACRQTVTQTVDPFVVLTDSERDILDCMARGLSNIGISGQMFLSAKTVECHVGSIFRKLRLHRQTAGNRRVQAVVVWLNATQRPGHGL